MPADAPGRACAKLQVAARGLTDPGGAARRGRRVAARPGSSSSVDLDLAGLGSMSMMCRLEVGVVHARLRRLARVPVILPVVVPVPPAVGPEAVHSPAGRAARSPPRRGPGSRGRGRALGRGEDEKGPQRPYRAGGGSSARGAAPNSAGLRNPDAEDTSREEGCSLPVRLSATFSDIRNA